MSIKGNLNDISFAELLRIISKYNGRLGVWNFHEKKQYECFLQNESLVYFNANGRNISENEAINSFIPELNSDKQSYYAFQKDAILDTKPQINLSLNKILSATVFSNQNPAELEQHLPNVLTKFEIVPEFNGNLSPELESLWHLSIHHFHEGCSPSQLADILGMNVKEVQIIFYKLRMIKAIKPVRLFNIKNVSSKAKNAGANLQKIINMRNGVKNAPVTSEVPSIDSQNQKIEDDLLQISSDDPPQPAIIAEKRDKFFDKVELDKVIEIPTNQQFINKYISPVSNEQTVVQNPTDNTEIVDKTNEAKPQIAPSPTKPIFDLNSNLGKQGLIKRMLSSLFSRKSH